MKANRFKRVLVILQKQILFLEAMERVATTKEEREKINVELMEARDELKKYSWLNANFDFIKDLKELKDE